MTNSTTTMSRENRFWGTLLFGTAIFASAFLIFLVQPMVGKRIVPWFGGTPGVWTLCLAFYQSSLFLGYAYAHLLVGRVSPFRQLGIHALLFALAFAVLPVLPGEAWKPLEAAHPSARILAMLGANVALPFVMLASTGPLLQAWFARAYPERSPYPLYALSNLGSLLALLAYPFFIEPHLRLSLNSDLWSWGFALCGVGVLSCAWLTARSGASATGSVISPNLATDKTAFRIGAARGALWVLLPASAVMIFMGVTNELCLDVASVPFLWVLPLCIYLLTFIICFASEHLYSRRGLVALALILLATLVLLGDQSPFSAPGGRHSAPVYSQIAGYALLLFVCCMLLHGELYRLRPPPAALTAYYLCVSGGGALGGLFVGLLAPRIFTGYDELPLGLVVGWALVLAAWWYDRTSVLRLGRLRWAWAGAAGASVAALVFQIVDWSPLPPHIHLQERNFYGVLRVFTARAWEPRQRQVMLRNGTTGHGFQLVDPLLRTLPTDYFAPISGIGIALTQRNPEKSWKVGIIGLGIGTLAAYGQPGDVFRFYEINPDVVRVARDSGHFSYLGDSEAKIEIVEGDGRLSLESELRAGGGEKFDVLILDAFSSDSIPVHLLTREAFELYGRHLGKRGLLAVHVTSYHLELAPLVYRLGESVGLHAMVVRHQQSNKHYTRGANWVLLSRHAPRLQALKKAGLAVRRRHGLSEKQLRFSSFDPADVADVPLWTDDYSDLFGVVKDKPLF